MRKISKKYPSGVTRSCIKNSVTRRGKMLARKSKQQSRHGTEQMNKVNTSAEGKLAWRWA